MEAQRQVLYTAPSLSLSFSLSSKKNKQATHCTFAVFDFLLKMHAPCCVRSNSTRHPTTLGPCSEIMHTLKKIMRMHAPVKAPDIPDLLYLFVTGFPSKENNNDNNSNKRRAHLRKKSGREHQNMYLPNVRPKTARRRCWPPHHHSFHHTQRRKLESSYSRRQHKRLLAHPIKRQHIIHYNTSCTTYCIPRIFVSSITVSIRKYPTLVSKQYLLSHLI